MNTTAAAAKAGEDACCHSKRPGNESVVNCSQEEELLVATLCFLLPLRSQFLFSFSKHQECTLGKAMGPKKKSDEQRGEREGKGSGAEQRPIVRRRTKVQMRKESRSGDAERGGTARWGAKSQITKSLCIWSSTTSCTTKGMLSMLTFLSRGTSSPGYRGRCSISRKEHQRGRWLAADMSKDAGLYAMLVEMLEESPAFCVPSLPRCCEPGLKPNLI